MDILPTNEELDESFGLYAFEIIADIILGIALGLTVNKVSNRLSNFLNLNVYLKYGFQLLLNIGVLYILKVDSKYLYTSWKGKTSYGIIFTAMFIASQKNLTKLLEKSALHAD